MRLLIWCVCHCLERRDFVAIKASTTSSKRWLASNLLAIHTIHHYHWNFYSALFLSLILAIIWTQPVISFSRLSSCNISLLLDSAMQLLSGLNSRDGIMPRHITILDSEFICILWVLIRSLTDTLNILNSCTVIDCVLILAIVEIKSIV